MKHNIYGQNDCRYRVKEKDVEKDCKVRRFIMCLFGSIWNEYQTGGCLQIGEKKDSTAVDGKDCSNEDEQ